MNDPTFAQTLKALLEQTKTSPETLGRELEIFPFAVQRWVNQEAQPRMGMQTLVINHLKKKQTMQGQELTQWVNAWTDLGEQADTGKMPLKQYNAIVRLWYQVSKMVPEIRTPAMQRHPSGEYAFEWSYRDQVITIDVLKDGTVEWFWLDRSHKEVHHAEGTIEECLMVLGEKLNLMKE